MIVRTSSLCSVSCFNAAERDSLVSPFTTGDEGALIDVRRAALELREDGVRVDAAERAVAPLVMFEVGVGEGDEGVRRLGGLRVATVLAMMR